MKTKETNCIQCNDDGIYTDEHHMLVVCPCRAEGFSPKVSEVINLMNEFEMLKHCDDDIDSVDLMF